MSTIDLTPLLHEDLFGRYPDETLAQAAAAAAGGTLDPALAIGDLAAIVAGEALTERAPHAAAAAVSALALRAGEIAEPHPAQRLLQALDVVCLSVALRRPLPDAPALQGLAVFTDSSLEWDDAVLAASVRLLHQVAARRIDLAEVERVSAGVLVEAERREEAHIARRGRQGALALVGRVQLLQACIDVATVAAYSLARQSIELEEQPVSLEAKVRWHLERAVRAAEASDLALWVRRGLLEHALLMLASR